MRKEVGSRRLDDIDTAKPVAFQGCGGESATEVIELSLADGHSIIEYLKTCCWREDFERNLHSTQTGLAGSMPITIFVDFLEVTSQPGFPQGVRDVAFRLAELAKQWRGVSEVSFTCGVM